MAVHFGYKSLNPLEVGGEHTFSIILHSPDTCKQSF